MIFGQNKLGWVQLTKPKKLAWPLVLSLNSEQFLSIFSTLQANRNHYFAFQFTTISCNLESLWLSHTKLFMAHLLALSWSCPCLSGSSHCYIPADPSLHLTSDEKETKSLELFCIFIIKLFSKPSACSLAQSQHKFQIHIRRSREDKLTRMHTYISQYKKLCWSKGSAEDYSIIILVILLTQAIISVYSQEQGST